MHVDGYVDFNFENELFEIWPKKKQNSSANGEHSYLHDVSDALPLLARRVRTGRIVCACMQNDHGTFRGRIQVFYEPIEVDRTGFGVPVAVLAQIREAGVEEYFVVVLCKSSGHIQV